VEVPGSTVGVGRVAAALVRAELDHGWAELVADRDRPTAWTLLVDGTAQSHVDLADPTHLEFEYVRRIGHLLDALDPPPPAPLAVLHLGGGAWTLPRYVAATRPRSRQQVLELDAALVELVRTRLPVDGLDLDVRITDARTGLVAAAGPWDVVVLDVFAGARIPAHLTSVEFLRTVAGVLAPGGAYVANLADGAGGRRPAPGQADPLAFTRGQAATAGAVFDEVAVVAAPEVLHGRRFGNLVLVAGGPGDEGDGGDAAGLPLAELARRVAADPFPARVEDGPAFAKSAAVVTDATAVPSARPPAGFFGQ
jgi:hypothetical protein